VDLVINLISGFCLLLGSFLILSGMIGVLRFPDFYTRMHAAGVTDTLAAVLVVFGLLLLSGWSLVSAKLLIIMVFLLFAGPTASHALAKAAVNHGLEPVEAGNSDDGEKAESKGRTAPSA
jgi:multicomponent Na+:H+ antiporter subunit G